MSAPRDDGVFLGHIRDAIARIESYVDRLTERDFLDTPVVQDAVIRQLQVIGEATKRLSGEYRAKNPGIPWADIAGMRDKLVHDYVTIDLYAVWDTATRDLDKLKAHLNEQGEAGTGSTSA